MRSPRTCATWIRLTYTLVDARIDPYSREREAVTLDIDDTCGVVHGYQQLSLFNAHYDERCFLPIHVYDTERSRPVAVVLHPGKTPSGVEIRAQHYGFRPTAGKPEHGTASSTMAGEDDFGPGPAQSEREGCRA